MALTHRLRAGFKAFMGGDAPASAQGLLRSIFPSGQAPRRGTRELLDAYRTLPWLRTVTHRLASDVARTPVTLYAPARGKRGSEGKALRLKSQLRGAPHAVQRTLLAEALERGELTQVEDHPFLDLVSTMNPALRAQASMHVTQAWLDLKGEAFWVLERNGAGQPVEAWPVPPHWIAETPSAGRPSFRASYSGWNRALPEADVVWMRHPDPLNPYGRGVGLAESLSDELDIDAFAAQTLRGHFERNGLPAAMVGLPGAGEAELEHFKERWLAQNEGMGKAGGVHFTNTEPKVSVFSQSLREQEMSALRQAQRDTVIQVFNVPPEVVGLLENSNRATIDSAFYLYALGCLEPRLAMRDDALQPLAEEWDERLVVSHVSTVPEDWERKQRAMQQVPTAFTLNEHRALAGALPLKGSEGEALYKPAPTAAAAPAPGTKGADPAWARELARTRAAPEDDDADTLLARVDAALEKVSHEALAAELAPVWRNQVEAWAKGELADLGAADALGSMAGSIASHLEDFGGDRLKGITATTRAHLRAALAEGVREGEDMRRLTARVRAVMADASDARAAVIARTEVMRSSNWASHAAHKASGVVSARRWVATPDGRTRDAHKALNGQQRGLDEPFEVGGLKAMHPGGFGVAAQDVQCRCTTVAVVEDVEEDPDFKSADGTATAQEDKLGAAWRAFDAKASSWEAEALSAVRRAFEAQERALVEALAS